MSETLFNPAGNESKPGYDEIDISTAEFWRQQLEEQDRSFRALRAHRPVSWQRPAEFAQLPDPEDPGYWAVTGHAEICEVSRNSEVFVSGQGVMYDTFPPEILQMSLSFEAMDPPRHGQLRGLVTHAFTPHRVRRVQEDIGRAAHALVESVADRGRIDFVADLATPLPLINFCDTMGVPTDCREVVAAAVADLVAWADPEILAGRAPDEVQMQAVLTLHRIAGELSAERLRQPTDDLFTALVQAEVDGRRLDPTELGAFFVLLSVAATATTKHTASFAALGLTDHPDQRTWLLADFEGRIDRAVEEMLRYGTVVMNMRRTAAVETTLGGMRIAPGDKVVMFYSSANRDESRFNAPHTMDLSRHPNPHLAFGGGGAHHCFGAQLARTQLRALFGALLTQIPDFRAHSPRFLGTSFMRGITHLDFEFTPARGR